MWKRKISNTEVRLGPPCGILPDAYGRSWTAEAQAPGTLRIGPIYLTLCDPTDLAHQTPLSMGFSRQEHGNGLPFPSPRRLIKVFLHFFYNIPRFITRDMSHVWALQFSLPLPFCWREFSGHPVVRALCSHCWGLSSIPRRGTKIPEAEWHSQKKNKQKKTFYWNHPKTMLPCFILKTLGCFQQMVVRQLDYEHSKDWR